MKKLLLALSTLVVTSSASTIVVSCSTKTKKQNIDSIERFLTAILHSKQNDQEPWTNDALEAELVNQKVDVAGGVSVKVSNEIKEGTFTNKQQSIVFIGNGTSKNIYKYSGSITLVYNFGGNKPAPKKKVTKEELTTTITGLKNFLDTIYFKSKNVVKNTFVSNANIPGTPAEGVVFKTVKVTILKSTESADPSIPKFTKFKLNGSIGIKDNDSEYYEFDDNVTEQDKAFICEGTIVDSVIIEDKVITKATESINNWIEAKNFNDYDDFKNKLLSQQKEILANEQIAIQNITNLAITENNANINSLYWTNQVSVNLKANAGYEFSKEVIENEQHKIKTDIKILKIESNPLKWHVLTSRDKKYIEPQFIQFNSAVNTSKIQKEYLTSQQITQEWNQENDKHQQKQFVESLNIFTGDDKDEKITKFVNTQYFTNTTAFNYGSQTSESLFKVDEILFFDKTQENLNKNIESVLGQTKSLNEFVSTSKALTKTTIKNTQNISYYVVFLTEDKDGNYKAANRTLNFLFQQVVMVD
ncbi:hypothetical protein MENTO_v1c05010 [Mesoplasma entomophilum]|uniref:Lipoprotein-associated type-17 domain-containing protein n=1 Tax=Mesoplasma entomophilum TaxID=2149 RepID=A0A3S5Y007_9MOLU|nr:hypothetical protein [Mesoplasma entomophilum]ATQ35636.1 hypothetical protein CS528_02590 [Mesoplasma entomophilum]ATZ19605.1 hypothetical protein MENTO_v1c05010 [Mesoplasma entomophilum]